MQSSLRIWVGMRHIHLKTMELFAYCPYYSFSLKTPNGKIYNNEKPILTEYGENCKIFSFPVATQNRFEVILLDLFTNGEYSGE